MGSSVYSTSISDIGDNEQLIFKTNGQRSARFFKIHL